ncbi:Sodium-coupled monocarboxylate transporter 1 [Mactra antiquata]
MADENKTSNLGVWDWLLFAAMLTICTGIGIFYAIKEYCSTHSNKTGEFLIGRRNMQRLPVAISILVSFVSSILILGAPAEIYTSGTLFYIYVVGIILGIVLASLLFVPLLYPLKLTSSFEYLELRFQSKAAKLTGTILMIVQQILYMGIASYAPSTALEAVTGFPTHVTIITLGGVSTFYTLLGGMKAVVWTGVVQSIFMITGVLAIVVQGTIQVGGLNEVWKLNGEWGRLVFWEFNPDPTVRHSVWSLVIGGGVAWLGTFGVNQASVQRYCSVGSLKESRWVVLLNVIGVFVLVTLTSLSGLVMFAYYAKKGCDPLANGNVDNSNQLIPFLVMEVLGYPGLPGIFVSCLFSGALGENLRPLVRLIVLSNLPSSSTSACLNALSAVTWEDIVKPLIHHRVSETKKIWIIKMIVAFYGAAGISFACIVQDFGGTVAQATLSFTGAATGPLLGIFLLGALFPWANSWVRIFNSLSAFRKIFLLICLDF